MSIAYQFAYMTHHPIVTSKSLVNKTKSKASEKLIAHGCEEVAPPCHTIGIVLFKCGLTQLNLKHRHGPDNP
ncbi:MAG: hypothetical protein ACXWIN_03655 [Burkholderiaceae bacterium]